MRLLVFVGLVVAGAMTLGPTQAQAQKCGSKFDTGCGGSGGDHWFELNPNGLSIGGFTHYDCLTCPIGGDCHPPCTVQEEDADVQEAYRDALAAADNQDITALAQAVRVIPRYVTLNVRRQSIQVLSCSGDEVIGNIQLPLEAVAEIQAQLQKE